MIDLPHRETGRITITRFITDHGEDLVDVHSDDMDGNPIGVVEALGLLELAKIDLADLANRTDDE